MLHLVKESMVTFAFGKLLLTFFGIVILRALRPKRSKLILRVTWSLVILYVAIAVWHVIGFLHITA